ncbi:single-strand binding protein family-domain-containing protein [Russula earlei]|uniref:Single-strand binding protein family-domain-containing protein n=1 Tax=Russula earlei TaxID=71964 RepID=A0ACC0UM16_9AGAM|nr:single-strand binding protein family-domain-containing protein [Russula earlei]
MITTSFSLRQALPTRRVARAFSTTPSRLSDVSKLILVGRLGKDPEVRTTRTDKEYVSYLVATTNYPPPPPGPDGTRPESKTTWHTIFSFNPTANNFLRNLQKGSQVYVEANFELREPDPAADPNTPQGQRQIFLRHETIRLLRAPPMQPSEETVEESS